VSSAGVPEESSRRFNVNLSTWIKSREPVAVKLTGSRCFRISQSTVLTNSTTVVFTVIFVYLHLISPPPPDGSVTAKFHYFQMPHSSRNYTSPSNSNTSKLQFNWFTAKFRYFQIQLRVLPNSCNPFESKGAH